MIPLYQKIMMDLKRQMDTGVLKPGDQLPTEKELSAKYHVSRITSKRALTELEQSGFISRVQGKGSFVKEHGSTQHFKKRILFLLPMTNDLSLANFSKGLLPVVQKSGFEVMITSFEFLNSHRADDIVKEFDGLIYYVNDEKKQLDLLFEFQLKQFPVIILDKIIHDIPFPSVLSDNFDGGKIACDYFIKKGHEKIGYLFASNNPPQSTRQRYLGYLQSMKDHHLNFHTAMDDPKAIPTFIEEFIEENQLTAMVCENDVTAIEVLKKLKKIGKKVPEEISLIGFDDIQAASFVEPPLTTVSQNFHQIGALAGEQLMQWMTTNKKPTHLKVPVDLIVRKSIKEHTKYEN